MKTPIWLDRSEALAIHDLLLAQHGGLAGVRDDGLLESALAKPQNRFAYESPTLAEMAAGYAAGIIRNHPFLDGNKRTGFMLAVTFLELNGLRFTATEESVVERTVALASKAITEAAYAAWIKANAKRA